MILPDEHALRAAVYRLLPEDGQPIAWPVLRDKAVDIALPAYTRHARASAVLRALRQMRDDGAARSSSAGWSRTVRCPAPWTADHVREAIIVTLSTAARRIGTGAGIRDAMSVAHEALSSAASEASFRANLSYIDVTGGAADAAVAQVRDVAEGRAPLRAL